MIYPIYKLKANGDLRLWDGPTLSKEEASNTLKNRQKDYPKDKFFIVKMKERNGIR